MSRTFFAIACSLVSGLLVRASIAGEIFVDVASEAGVEFTHSNGATGLKQYWETMGSGVCLFDFDGDDRIDVYAVTGVGENRLYRNLGGLRFEDVTESAGVGDDGYGMAAAACDVDNDGDADLYVTNFGPNRFYVNRGDGTFQERSAASGLDDEAWGCGASFFDADGDGLCDVYVANYVGVARPDTNVCWARGREYRLVCKPTDYPAQADVFFRNRGDGTFEEATDAFGFAVPTPGRGLGTITFDYDRDGKLDLYVANDLDPNFLFHNLGGGRFEEVGFFTGTSHSEHGLAESGMGVAVGDYDEDGWLDLFVTNFRGQTNTLYHNEGSGFFLDESASSRLGPISIPHVGWGAEFLDFDLDGHRDLFVVNGHVEPDANRANPDNHSEQPDQLFRNLGDGTFEDVTTAAAAGFLEPHVGRGAAVADLDSDGDPEIVVLNQNSRLRLFENRGNRDGRHWIGVHLRGDESNRDAIGARVELVAGDLRTSREVRAGASFLSQNDPRLLFGLGSRAAIDSVNVLWPSGRRQSATGLEVDRYHVISEGRE